MTQADTAIAALRSGHDRLADFVADLDDADLTRPSGASEWTVAQVLSHLGSGAEINYTQWKAQLDGSQPPPDDFAQGVWDRWNAMTPREQADEFLVSDERFVAWFEGIDDATREQATINLGFLPAPLDIATTAAFRLREVALHAWDFFVSFDPQATLAPEAPPLLLHAQPDLTGWIAKADQVGEPAVLRVITTEPDSDFTLRLGESVSIELEAPEQPDGTFTLPAEAWLRLVAGRLGPDHTPETVTASGAADLDVLRRVFPGY